MKTWTMPKVAVEAFRANDYVAATCVQPVNPIQKNKNYAVDFVYATGGAGQGTAAYTPVLDGETSQLKYDRNVENIVNGQLSGMSFYPGVYHNKKIYEHGSIPSGDFSYNESYFKALDGTYTIWVTNSAVHFWVYEGYVDIDTSSTSPWNASTGSNRS